ncbi:SCP2 sterol-binding domain-containing protein [Thiovibrio sp. JS02]
MENTRAVHAFFNEYLPAFLGKRLIPNLASLSAVFWIAVKERGSWSLTIEGGILSGVRPESAAGDFGYRTDSETFLAVARAQLSPQKSFFTGRTKISGNFKEALRTATALEEFFRLYPFPEDGSPIFRTEHPRCTKTGSP